MKNILTRQNCSCGFSPYFFAAILLLLSFFTISCRKDDDTKLNTSPDKDIAANLSANADYSILNEAIIKAGLQNLFQGSTEYTLFAPPNAAFETYFYQTGVEGLAGISQQEIKALLLNHVISGKILTSSLQKGYIETINTSAPDNKALVLYVSNTKPFIIDGSRKIINPDIICNNGVIHGVDKVIRPESLVDHIMNNPDFSMLIQLVLSSGMSDTLVSGGPFTIFAPTNAVFEAAMDSMGLTTLDPTLLQQLAPLSLYHLLEGNYTVADIPQGNVETMLPGFSLSFDKSSGQIRINNSVNITTPDIQATNGVVHIVDGFCVPELK